MSTLSRNLCISSIFICLLFTQACAKKAPEAATPEAAPAAEKKADEAAPAADKKAPEAAKPAAAPAAAKAAAPPAAKPTVAPTGAAAPAADLPVDQARVAEAKKVVDETADIMQKMVGELKAAGGDKAKMQEIQNTYKEKSMGIQKRGKEIADKMNAAEKKLLQAHASEVLRPVIQEMFTLMNPHGGAIPLPRGPRPPAAAGAPVKAAPTAGAVPPAAPKVVPAPATAPAAK